MYAKLNDWIVLIILLLFIPCIAIAESPTNFISYKSAGWSFPLSGKAALKKYRNDNPIFPVGISRVTKKGFVVMKNGFYIIEKGQKLPGFNDNCKTGNVLIKSIDKNTFHIKSIGGKGFCLLNFSVILPVGSRLKVTKITLGRHRLGKGYLLLTRKGMLWTRKQ